MFAVATVSLMSTFGLPLVPLIARELEVTVGTAQWTVTILLVVGAAASPIVGRLGDGAQRNRVLFVTLGVMTVGCVVAASAASFSQLIAGRVLQGVGYGLLPLVIGIARDHLPARRRTGAMATLAVTGAASSGLGFPLTGLLADRLGYQGAFWFGVACSCLALAAVVLVVPPSPPSRARVRLDLPGAVLCVVGLSSMLLALSRGATWGWASLEVIGLALTSLVALSAWIAVERRVREPMIDLVLAARPAVAAVHVVSLASNVAAFGLMVLIVLLVQVPISTGYGFGGTALMAGLLTLPFSIGVLASRAIPRMSRLTGRSLMVGGSLTIVVASLALALRHDAEWLLAVAAWMIGLGAGTTHAATPAIIAANVPHERTSSAFGANQVMRGTGAAIGSALAVTVLTAATAQVAAHPSSAAFTAAFLVLAVTAVPAALAALMVPRTPGPAAAPASTAELEAPLP